MRSVIGAISKTKKKLIHYARGQQHNVHTPVVHTHTHTLVAVGSGSRRSRDLGYDIMGYYNGSQWTGSGGTWVQGVEHRVCDIQRVPPPARCTIDRWGGGGDGGGRRVAKNARNVFTPTTASILLPLPYYQLPLPLLPRYYHYMYTIPLPLLPRRCCCCCCWLCAVPLCIRRKALVEYSRRRHRVRRESFEISAFVPV